jgi:hypothetical protein
MSATDGLFSDQPFSGFATTRRLPHDCTFNEVEIPTAAGTIAKSAC